MSIRFVFGLCVWGWALSWMTHSTEPLFQQPVADVWTAGTSGNGTLVLVGATGRILVSTNGIHWISHRLLTNTIGCITHGGGRFMAITTDGIPQTSANGKDWTALNRMPLTAQAEVTGVAYSTAAGVFAAVDSSGAIWTSPDGTAWKEVYRTTDGETFYGIASNGGYLAAISHYFNQDADELGRITVSSNATTWRKERQVEQELSSGIFWVQNKFMVVGVQGSNEDDSLLLVSEDNGANWSDKNVAGVSSRLVSAFHADGQFFLIDEDGKLYASADGIKLWKPVSDPADMLSSALGGLATPAGRPVLFGYSSIVFQPASATSWIDIGGTETPDFTDIACGNSLCVGIADSDLWIQGADGNWTPLSIPLDSLSIFDTFAGLEWTSITFGQGQFLLTGNVTNGDGKHYGFLLSSQDGLHWSVDRAVPDQTYAKYIFAQAKYLAVGTKFTPSGKSPLILWSTVRATWTEGTFATVPAPSRADLVRIVDGVTGLVAHGESGTIFHSPNGVAWQDVSLESEDSLSFGLRTDFGYALFDFAGYGWYSTDGKAWTEFESSIPGGIGGMIYTGGKFMAVGERGNIWTSPNGNVWTNIKTPTIEHLLGITQSSSGFVAVGDHGTVLTSMDGMGWTLVYGHPTPNPLTVLSTLDPGGVTFSISGKLNSTFAVVHSDSLGEFESWLQEPQLTLTNSPLQLRVPFGGAGSRFHRIETLPTRP